MILPGTSFSATTSLIGVYPGPLLRRSLCSKSPQTLSANAKFRIPVDSSILQACSPTTSATLFIRSFNLVRAFRPGQLRMGDLLRTDGVPSPNGHAAAAVPTSLANYSFPQDRLKTLSDSKKTPVVLMACGSLSVSEHCPERYVLFLLFSLTNVLIALQSLFSTSVSYFRKYTFAPTPSRQMLGIPEKDTPRRSVK